MLHIQFRGHPLALLSPLASTRRCGAREEIAYVAQWNASLACTHSYDNGCPNWPLRQRSNLPKKQSMETRQQSRSGVTAICLHCRNPLISILTFDASSGAGAHALRLVMLQKKMRITVCFNLEASKPHWQVDSLAVY